MTWWDKLKAIAKREAGAAKEELGRAADALDEALAKKERELNATPAERVDMLLEEIAEEDRQFGELEDKLRTEGSERASRAGIEPPVRAPAPEVDLTSVKAHLTVAPVEASVEGDKTSHVVALDEAITSVVAPGDIVNDLLAEVMVLDAALRDRTISLRTPTLDVDAVSDLVAGVIAARAPELATPPPRLHDPDLDDPGDEGPEDGGPEDLAH